MPTLQELLTKHGLEPVFTKTRTKAEMLLDEVIFKYHPDVKDNDPVQQVLRKHIEWINIERMVEETMAAVGGYEFVDAAHYDFSDGTDSKTASVQPSARKRYGVETNSYLCEITGIGNVGDNSQVKSGALRVIVYNPHTQRLEYYFIPNKDMLKEMRYHSGGYRITTTWNINKEHNNKLAKYEVDSFLTLATLPASFDWNIWRETKCLTTACGHSIV